MSINLISSSNNGAAIQYQQANNKNAPTLLQSLSLPLSHLVNSILFKKDVSAEANKARQAYLTKLSKDSTISASGVKLRVKGSALLDGIKIRSIQNSSLPIEKQTWVVFFNGFAPCWHIGEHVSRIQKECGVNVINYDYRGHGASTGELLSEDDAISDGVRIVSSLFEKGVRPERTILQGHSLGGGVALCVAARLADMNANVNVLVDRTYVTLAEAAPEFLIASIGSLLDIGKTLPSTSEELFTACATVTLGKLWKAVRGFFTLANPAMKAARFELNTRSACTKIRGHIGYISHPEDSVFGPARFENAFESVVSSGKISAKSVTKIEMSPENDLENDIPHNRPLRDKELQAYRSFISKVG